MNMKNQIKSLIVATFFTSTSISAQQVTIEVTNLTNGIYFTPLLISAHNAQTHLYQLGEAASANLQALAEGGDISGLASDVDMAGGDSVKNPADGLLAPGGKTSISATFEITESFNRFSIVAMMLPTNDGFIGLDAKKIPSEPGVYTYFLNGYDAGTEANDEIVNGGGMPGMPGIPEDPGAQAGTGGTGVMVSSKGNEFVHIHSNVIGDTDASGGMSDLDSRVHRWLNPVARVVLTVK
jgi:hypothetical protein